MVSMQGMALCLNSKKLLRLPGWVNTEEERHRILVPPGVQFLGPILDHSRNTEGTKLREGQSNSLLPNDAVLDRI